MRWLIALLLTTRLLHAEDESAGDFDYYVLSLSWSPNWCALEGGARNSPQCDARRRLGWVLHGLWPQYEDGWPSYCRTSERDPGRAQTAGMADIMGTQGAAWYQWKKHGRCSGLSPENYFMSARKAFMQVVQPEAFARLKGAVSLPASVVEEAFLQANPTLTPDMITVTCQSGRIQEVRICLTPDLEFRGCEPDVARDCKLQDALVDPIP